jgi:uncharacterized protein
MELSGSLEVAAPRDRVWAFIVDPQQVGWCGPGVESIEQLDPTRYRATAKVGIGVISTRFSVDLELVSADPQDVVVIQARGHAPASVVEASGEMRLTGPSDGPTTMAWQATIRLEGAIASLGERLVQGTARKLADEAFACIKTRLEA